MTFFGPPIRNGVPIGLGSSIGFGSAPFTPAELFYSGEQGFWYDPTDIPLAWRRNLLTRTEEFDNVAWTKTNGTITANTDIAPDGTLTADTFTATSANAVLQQDPAKAGGMVNSVWLKRKTGTGAVQLLTPDGVYVAVNLTNIWIRFEVAAQATVSLFRIRVTTSGDEVYVWGAQAELGSTASNYQQIVTPEISFLTYQSQPVLYTDSTGTTPVTAVEQAVGLMLDKSGRGNHAFQTSSAKRPVLRARYNQFTYSEDFGNVAWTATGTTVATNTTVSPDGAITADTLTASAGTSGKNIRQSGGGSGSSLTFSVYAKVGTHDFVQLFHGSSSNIFANFNLLTGVVGTVGASATASITSVGSGWYRCQITFTPASASALRVAMVTSQTAAFDENWNAVGTETILLWGADLRPTSQATGLIGPTYQRIAAATDYDVSGFLPYVQFDGFDDAMTTNSIDFTATDEVTVFAGVRKLSDATRGVFTEFSATTANTGVFSIDAPGLSGGVLRSYLFVSKGTATAAPFQDLPNNAAPTSSVITGIGDISGDVATLRVNGTQAATSSADQGTGNYGNYPLFIGARDQTSLYFNGEIYSLIGRGAATTAGQIAATEQWVGQRTGVQL